jgi:DNA-binding transcriptional ArsR family regulator
MTAIRDDRLDELLRALGHPARRALFRACLDGPRAAGDLVGVVGLAPASVSEHLRVLRKAGLLELETRGRFWMYRAAPEVLRSAAAGLAELAVTARSGAPPR